MSLQERFIASGFNGFNDQQIVTLILSLCKPYREARKIAKECLANYSNLGEFLAASQEELIRTGITNECVSYIKLIQGLPAEILKRKFVKQPFYQSSREIFEYLYYTMRDLKKEVFKAVYLNNKNEIITTVDIFEGTVENIPIHPREIIESAISHNASSVIFVHNHPSGDTTPSKSDKQCTRDLVFIGKVTQIKVLDHIIIGGNSYFSFADEGLINKYELDFLNLKIRSTLSIEPDPYSRKGKYSYIEPPCTHDVSKESDKFHF
jgi:DNA repair protein RadC